MPQIKDYVAAKADSVAGLSRSQLLEAVKKSGLGSCH